MGDMLRHDAERLKILIERHKLHTGSTKAAQLLENWEESLKSFVKVMPTDYERALKQLEAEREDDHGGGKEAVEDLPDLIADA